MRRLLILTHLVLPLTTTAMMFSSCSNSHVQPFEPNVNIKLTSAPYAFSNFNLPSDKGCKYNADIFGDLQIGDEVFLSVGQQYKDDREGQYLSLDSTHDYFKIVAPITNFTFVVNSISTTDTSFYSVRFALNLHIFRDHQIWYKTQLNDLYFINATATTKELFLTEKVDGETTILSFNPDPILHEQLKLCNILVIPDGITKIGDSAFADGSIPSNIEKIFLDISVLCPFVESTLKSIGNNAFSRVHWENELILPKSLEWIGDSAFYYSSFQNDLIIPNNVHHIGNSAFEGVMHTTSITLPKSVIELGNKAFYQTRNVLQIDLCDFVKLGDLNVTWGTQLLSSTVSSSEKKVLFSSSLQSSQVWETFFENHNTDLSSWRFVGK